MTYQTGMKTAIADIYDDLFKYAGYLGDNLNFKPDLPDAKNRTPLNMLRECVTVTDFFIPILETQQVGPMVEDDANYPAGLDTLEDCRRYYEERKDALLNAVENFPDDKLTETVDLPWGTYSWVQMIAYLHWNAAWHAGQMAYIGMMHGDERM